MYKHLKLKNYDYFQNGYYFITTCIKDRKQFFGKIINEKIILNQYGLIAKQQWLWLQKQYKYVYLDEFIIMPDHFHGILIINDENIYNHMDPVYQVAQSRLVDEVAASRDSLLPSVKPIHEKSNKIKPLPELIGAFKTTSSKLIHKKGLLEFKWQKSFYERIIRNDSELNKFRNYIKFNYLKENNLC